MKRKIIYFCIILTIGIAVYLLKKHFDMEKEYYVCSAGGETPVTNLIKKYGYKQLGPCKLWNPNPQPITNEELELIKINLPKWFHNKYPNEEVNN